MKEKILKRIRIIIWKISTFLHICVAESNLIFANEKIFDEVFDTFSEKEIQRIKKMIRQYIYVITDDKIKERVRKLSTVNWNNLDMDLLHETKVAWLLDLLWVIDYKIETSKRNIK